MKKTTVLGSTLCKRISAIMLCVCMLVMACGCDSIDYKKATKLYNNGEWNEAIEIFESLGSYEDSKDMVNACNYEKATELYENKEYDEAIEIFESLGEYKDSADRIKEYIYLNAVALMNEGKYEEAITTFENIGENEYKDSAEQIVACETAIKDREYSVAIALMNEGKYEEAIATFESFGENGYKDSAEQIVACETAIKDREYSTAVALMDAGNCEEAIAKFRVLGEYNDSAEQVVRYELSNMQDAKVDDYVFFGSYEQDNDMSNGKESIEWLVLAKKGTKVLLISRYGLDAQPYNTEYIDIIWEKCTLRSWLNNDFYNAAFSSKEKDAIIQTKVTTPDNDATDNVFVLSIKELNKYFSDYDVKMCAPTDYAIAQGVETDSSYSVDGKAACWWWLRSVRYDHTNQRYSYSDGWMKYVFYSGMVNCVRPAMWVDLEA